MGGRQNGTHLTTGACLSPPTKTGGRTYLGQGVAVDIQIEVAWAGPASVDAGELPDRHVRR